MMADEGCPAQKLDVSRLQERLKKDGAILHMDDAV